MTETMIQEKSPFDGSEFNTWYQHDWSEPSKDILYTSKAPWSYDQVIVHVAVCSKCQMVHRYIVSGMDLAIKKGLQTEEGFYFASVKMPNPGCPYPNKDDMPPLVNTRPFENLPEWKEIEKLD